MSEMVFAFGSNMCSGRFRDYSVVPEGGGRAALLQDYRLCFNKRSRDGSGKANVERYSGGEVWGVLYTISEPHLKVLDEGEGPGYYREKLRLCTPDGEEAWVYLAHRSAKDSTLRPYSWYKRFLVEGAREHSLPASYIDALERIEADEDRDVKRDREKRSLV